VIDGETVATINSVTADVTIDDESAVTVATEERAADCDCWDAGLELPCWPCYRDGFRSPNPEEPASDD